MLVMEKCNAYGHADGMGPTVEAKCAIHSGLLFANAALLLVQVAHQLVVVYITIPCLLAYYYSHLKDN